MTLLELDDKVYKIPNKVMEAFEDMSDYIKDLEKENKILKKNTIHNDKVVDLAKWNENIYKSRINKALKFIDSMFDDGDGDKIIDNLLKLEEILKGEE